MNRGQPQAERLNQLCKSAVARAAKTVFLIDTGPKCYAKSAGVCGGGKAARGTCRQEPD